MKEYIDFTKDKKEISKLEGYGKLIYEANKNIMMDKLVRFKNEVNLSDNEIKLLELYNEFCAKF